MKKGKIIKLLEEYELSADWCAFGFDYEVNKYFIVFKYPYQEYTFHTFKELETILKERKYYIRIVHNRN